MEQFREDSVWRFQNPRTAIKELKNIGLPPKPSSFDFNKSGRQVKGAIAVIVALTIGAQNSGDKVWEGSRVHLETNWSLFAPWIKFLGESFIDSDGPSTLEEVEFRELVIFLLPSCLVHIAKEVPQLIYYIHIVFSRVWVRLLEEDHPAFTTWGSSWNQIQFDDQDARLGSILYNDHVVSVYSQFLIETSRRLSPLAAKEDSEQAWKGLAIFMDLLLSPRFSNPMDRRNPITKLSVPIAHCVRVILCKQQSLRHAHFDSEAKLPHAIATRLFLYLTFLIKEPFWTIKVLDVGIMKAIFRTYPYFFEGDTDPSTSHKFSDYAGEIFDNVSRLLLYPQVLRRFLREIKEIEASGHLEAQLSAKSTTLSEKWTKMKQKAFAVQEFRQGLKARLFFNYCSRRGCTRYRFQGDLGQGKPGQYYRCSRCLWEKYCSKDCQRLDWPTHKLYCQEAADRNYNFENIQPKSQDDVWNFESWLEPFLRTHAGPITAAVVKHRAQMTETECRRDGKFSKKNLSNPVICINFDIPGFPTVEENVELVHPDTLDFEFYARNSVMEVDRRWKLQAGQYLVYGLFPSNKFNRGRELLSWIFDPVSPRGQDQETVV